MAHGEDVGETQLVREKKTMVDRCLDWVFQQGTSTVLLVALAVYIAWQAPKYLEANQAFMRETMVKFEAEQEKTRTSYSALITVMREEHRLDRESMRRTIKEVDAHAKENP